MFVLPSISYESHQTQTAAGPQPQAGYPPELAGHYRHPKQRLKEPLDTVPGPFLFRKARPRIGAVTVDNLKDGDRVVSGRSRGATIGKTTRQE
jgi:hypothetical protein